jgi:hypothetical protein
LSGAVVAEGPRTGEIPALRDTSAVKAASEFVLIMLTTMPRRS